MIKTSKDHSTFDAIKRVQVLIVNTSFSEYKLLKQMTKDLFPGKDRVDIVYYLHKKKYPEDFEQSIYTTYLCKSDFSVFRRLKNPKLIREVLDKKHDALLVLGFQLPATLKKLIALKKVDLKIGAERETLPNFDLSFILSSDDNGALLKQAVKYLKTV